MQPQYAFKRSASIVNHVRSALNDDTGVALFLDYDGTLVPIRRSPRLARLSPRTNHMLKRLLSHSNIAVTLVTGRSLEDIKKMVGFSKLLFAANHGFQISSSKKNWVHPEALKVRRVLEVVRSNLTTTLSSVPGAFVEDKRYTLTVHYRRVQPSQVPRVKRLFENVIKPFRGRVRITRGKKVFEVRPHVVWGKGHAVLRILKSLHARTKPLVLYIGDDATDEDAFKMLRGKAITIRAGKSRRTRAAYYVRNQREVLKMLEMITTVGTQHAVSLQN